MKGYENKWVLQTLRCRLNFKARIIYNLKRNIFNKLKYDNLWNWKIAFRIQIMRWNFWRILQNCNNKIKAYNNCTNSIKMFIKFNNEYYFKFKKQWKILNV